MAVMSYREANHMLWRGVRPAHDGTQIIELNAQVGVGNSIVYTIGAGVNLYLTYLELTSRCSAAAPCGCWLGAYTAAPALWKYLLYQYYDLAGQQSIFSGLFYPVEIPASHTIRVESNHANLDVRAVIHGWIE